MQTNFSEAERYFMEHHCPKLLIAGYADDINAASNALADYPGSVHLADERSEPVAADWADAIIVYAFSRDTGYSSQLKSLFTLLHSQVPSRHEVALVLEDLVPRAGVFPELAGLPRTTLAELPAYVRDATALK